MTNLKLFEELLADDQLCEKLHLNPSSALKRHFDIPARNIKSKVDFFVSKSWTEAKVKNKDWSKWNRISEDLILGKIVTVPECDELIQFASESSFAENKDAPKKRLGLVISIVDYFELGGNLGFTTEIARPSHWEKNDIEQFSLPVRDFGAEVPAEALINALDKMRQCRERGELTYVHCKAGRGRSTMLCAIFLALLELEKKFERGEATPDEEDEQLILRIENEIKKSRKHIELGSEKVKKAVETIRVVKSLWKAKASIKNQPVVSDLSVPAGENKESKDPLLTDSSIIKDKLEENFLSTPQAKTDISQMIYFKELAIYAAKEKEVLFGTTKRTKYISDFFKLIFEAKDDGWYRDFDKHLQDLIDANPTSKTDKEQDKAFRRELVTGFKQELTAYVKMMKSAYKKPESIPSVLAEGVGAGVEAGPKLEVTGNIIAITRTEARTTARAIARSRIKAIADAVRIQAKNPQIPEAGLGLGAGIQTAGPDGPSLSSDLSSEKIVDQEIAKAKVAI